MPVLTKLVKFGSEIICTYPLTTSSRRWGRPIDKIGLVMVLRTKILLHWCCWKAHVDPLRSSTVPFLQHLPVYRRLLPEATLPQGGYNLDCVSYLGSTIFIPEGANFAILQGAVAK
jgi:hypothetical protein